MSNGHEAIFFPFLYDNKTACYPRTQESKRTRPKHEFRNNRPIIRILKLNLSNWYICTSRRHRVNSIVQELYVFTSRHGKKIKDFYLGTYIRE